MLQSLWANVAGKGKKDIRTILKANMLFKELSPKDLRFVTNILHIRHYHNGETVFRQGEIGFGMYIIAEGTVDITTAVQNSDVSNQADETLVTRLGPDDFFGELALVEENGTRSANARAVTDTRLIGFFKPDLLEILERRPATGVKILLGLSEVLAQRLIDTTGKMARLNEELHLLKGETAK
ncbi:MAG: cyclic nucleotide-binding domain-containing protein [Thermodesulfobacteriota bacterium]